MKNNFFKIISSIALISLFLFISYGSGKEKDEVKCDSSNEGYKIGYKIGKNSLWDDPETYLRECNRGNGMIGEVPPCWREGFRDGHSNK